MENYMKILVTGHNGYIGTVLTPKLLNQGFDVVGLDTNFYERCAFGEYRTDFQQINKDIRDVDEDDLKGFDAIIHLAALSNDPLGNLNPDLTYEINYTASVNLAILAKKVGVKRFLFSSSCSIYGAAGDKSLTEEADFNPVTPYGHSKVLVERDLRKLADDDFSPIYLRNATAYGVSPLHRFDIVLNNLAAWAFATGLVFLKSDGSPWRPIVHVDDISHAFIIMLNAPREVIHNQAFNIGVNEENYRIRDLADIVKNTVPDCKVEYAKDAEPDKRTYRVDFSKVRLAFPDFQPRWNASLGAAELYHAYKNVGIKLEEFEGPKYKRIDHIKKLLQDGLLNNDLRWTKVKIQNDSYNMKQSIYEQTMNKNQNQTEKSRRCRFCNEIISYSLVDLGMSPLCESYISPENLNRMEPFYPLHVYVCESCYLVQLEEYVSPEHIFTEYAYFSSYADSWLRHAKNYTDMVTDRFKLNPENLVVEVASNDGYLLQYFVEKGIPVLGVEPARNVAKVAIEKGVPTLVEFFGVDCARKMVRDSKKADLIIGNNVLAQVPDLNDFVAGMKVLLKNGGVITLEFPHLMRLIEENQFDTIYHEHFSYFSFITTEKIFATNGLTIFDVDELPTHGGSLRIYACHQDDKSKSISKNVVDLHAREIKSGFTQMKYYAAFSEQVKETKRAILSFLIEAKRRGCRVVGYGAPGKGNTLLNYCGIRTDFLDYTVDRNPYKQGKFLPGTRIPIFHPDKISETKPDYVLILPWNLKDEIVQQMNFIYEWGGQFVVPIPKMQIITR
jgi:nucleoside-diphosphate-sugar epimerase/SAM-dependent methyltransferase